MTFKFDARKQAAAVKAIEALCYHCKDHSDECPINVALGELQQKYDKSSRPTVQYEGFEFDAKKVRKAISAVEAMCYHCKDHSYECPISRTTAILSKLEK